MKISTLITLFVVTFIEKFPSFSPLRSANGNPFSSGEEPFNTWVGSPHFLSCVIIKLLQEEI